MTRKFVLFFVLVFTTNLFANVCLSVNLKESPFYTYDDDIKINSFDNVKLSANLFVPKNLDGPYPTVIFVNSWTLEEHEYIRQAIELAKKGYQVLSYSTRGWGCSEGYVDVIGPKDMKDLSTIVDWLEARVETDMKNIGIAGISYGGGMTLMGMAKEPRIKTGFAMSTWGSLYEAMYHQETPRLFWSTTLMATGFLLGRVDNVLTDKFKKLILSDDKTEIQDWAFERSPIKHIDEVNKRKAPIYISNNLGDNLFQPNNVIRYFHKLKGPKILDLNQGTHATGELSGLFTVSNYTFKKMHSWFDYWLRDVRTDSDLKFNQINIQTDLKHERDSITGDRVDNSPTVSFDLTPRKILRGGLRAKEKSKRNYVDRIRSGLDTFASTGIPLISAIVDGHFKIPVYSYMPLIDPLHGMRYTTPRLKAPLKIRGIPKLTLNLDSHKRPYQLVAYLYDVNILGAGKLITHGVVSGDKINGEVNFEIVATAYDVPKGHKLALVLDTKDLLYAPKSLKPFKLDFHYSSSKINRLEIPVK